MPLQEKTATRSSGLVLPIPACGRTAVEEISDADRGSRRKTRGLVAGLLGVLVAVPLIGCGSSSSPDAAPAPQPAPAPPPVAGTACLQPTDGGTVTVGSGQPGDPSLPEPSSGYRLGKKVVRSSGYMVVTANPLATRAGCDILAAGGSAVDAAVAVQMVLGLVEPQSSGIGGGAFVMIYDAASGQVKAYDGRETAPAAATEDYLRWVSADDRTAPLPSARASGRAIGTPGTVRVLDQAHRAYGKLAWGSLMAPAIGLASNGFAIGGRMAAAIDGASTQLIRDPAAAAYFLQADGTARPLGSTIRNPDYAATLQAMATAGADAFYSGEIAQAIIDSIGAVSGRAPDGTTVPITPGLTTLADLSGYRATIREPICTDYRSYRICGMPPPSSGGIAVAQTLGILANFDLASHRPVTVNDDGGKPSIFGVHLISEAERLAYADRNAYVADTDFVPLPGGSPAAMLAPAYLAERAALIRMEASMGVALPGTFASPTQFAPSSGEGKGTSHVSIVDAAGNAVSMTTTIESSMGSYHFARGFLLNNEMTDFAAQPEAGGLPVANRVEAGKRPRSSMAPTLVFHRKADGTQGDLAMVTGSPGGATIIQFVVKTLVGALDWGLDAQQATAMVNFGSSNTATTGVGGENPNIDTTNAGNNDALILGLRALGHEVSILEQSSGVSTIIRVTEAGQSHLEGGADPRREGIVLGGP